MNRSICTEAIERELERLERWEQDILPAALSGDAEPAFTVLDRNCSYGVRCSSRVDWPVYPRLSGTMQGSTGGRNARPEFREFVPERKDPAKFINDELSPYADAYEEITDQAFESFKHADAINRHLVHLSRLDNFDWQPPAIEVIARRRSDPDFILRFLSDLERLAYGLFLARADPSERIRRYGKLLVSTQSGEDLFCDKSPLQLEDSEKSAVRQTLAGDIYTVTRIRLPLLLRLDELLSGGSAVYNSPIISVEHVMPQSPRAGSDWLTDFPNEADRGKWVHKLANLVLLTRRKNSQAGNLEFPEKKSKYFSTKAGVSNFALTSKVLAETAWTP